MMDNLANPDQGFTHNFVHKNSMKNSVFSDEQGLIKNANRQDLDETYTSDSPTMIVAELRSTT